MDIDCVVIGAGVVGLAIARRLALADREVVILEANDRIGAETSSRNSEVIHAGIYYPTDSAKARLCVAGKWQLYDFCESHGVPHRRIGKLIVAAGEGEIVGLEALAAQAADNGVDDLVSIGQGQLREMEPALRGAAALLSPSTGIIDSHAFMLALLGDAEDHGAMLALNSPVQAGEVTDQGIRLTVGGADTSQIEAGLVINSAGLDAQNLARMIDGLDPGPVPPAHYAKGNYYALAGRAPFSHLIYPMPEPGGLGVHLTLDMGGQARFGPDVEWIETRDYSVDPERSKTFYGAIRQYWPELPDESLHADYCGIRPKLVGPDEPAADFVIQGPDDTGSAAFIALYGIESPGLTASLAIADRVGELAGV